jgi:hypothetical protein
MTQPNQARATRSDAALDCNSKRWLGKSSAAVKPVRTLPVWTSQSGTKFLTAVGVLKVGFELKKWDAEVAKAKEFLGYPAAWAVTMETQSGWREAFAPATGSGESGVVAPWPKDSHYG